MKKILVLMAMGMMSLSVASAQQEFDLTDGLTLDEAIDIALSHNPTIKVADLEVERYDYVYNQAVSSLYPQIDASAQYALSLRQQQMAEGLSFGGKHTFNLAGNITLPLFVPSVYRQMKMTKTQMSAAVESARASRIDMVAAIRTSYYNVLLAQQALDVLLEARNTTQRVVDDTELMYQNDLVSEYDYITAKVQLSNLEPQILQARNGIEITKLQLKMYLSLPESTDFEVVGSLDDFRQQVLLGGDYTADVDLEDNTTIKTLDYQEELLVHQEKLIQTTRMPTIAAFGSISYIGQERVDLSALMGDRGGSASAANQSKFWWQYPISIGAQISIPIFSGLKKTNQLREARNQQRQLREQRDYVLEGIRLQLHQSVNTLLTARETMLANEAVVEQAGKAYSISLARYDAGAGTILELNSAQLSQTQAQLNYSQSIYDYLSAYAEYMRVLGNEGHLYDMPNYDDK